MTEPTTPLMQQYHAVKKQHPAALLLFRLGDFYELFYDDAKVASKILQITLTSRNKEKEGAVPMCGVPYHAAENYIARLIRAGHKVAICEQMEEPGPGKKIVRREVIRVLTPGTATGAGLVEAKENNFLAAVARSSAASCGDERGRTRELARRAAGRERLGWRLWIYPPANFALRNLRAKRPRRGCATNWGFCGRARCCCRSLCRCFLRRCRLRAN